MIGISKWICFVYQLQLRGRLRVESIILNIGVRVHRFSVLILGIIIRVIGSRYFLF